MSVVLFLVAVGLGVVIGTQLGAGLLELQSASARGRRLAAVRDAEDRVRAVQAAALHDLADAATQVIDVQTGGRAHRWPSERAGRMPDVRGDR